MHNCSQRKRRGYARELAIIILRQCDWNTSDDTGCIDCCINAMHIAQWKSPRYEIKITKKCCAKFWCLMLVLFLIYVFLIHTTILAVLMGMWLISSGYRRRDPNTVVWIEAAQPKFLSIPSLNKMYGTWEISFGQLQSKRR
jgi:hypothetical protein